MGAISLSVISNSALYATTGLPSPYPPARFSHWQCRNARFRSIRSTLSGSSSVQFTHGRNEFDIGPSQDIKSTNVSKVVKDEIKQNASASLYIDEDIVRIRRLFSETKNRQASVSAYDTAWVAMVPSLEDSQLPQFPQCLSWIMNHQLWDGSWGLSDLPYIKDRLSHTLACVIALRMWNAGIKNVEMG